MAREPHETPAAARTPSGAQGTRLFPGDAVALPAPRGLPGRISVPGRLALPRDRQRHQQVDEVTFAAPCPACGRDCDWTEERVDTRLRVTVHCPCPPPQPAA